MQRRWKKLTDRRQLRAYRDGVIERAEHHARSVHHIAPILIDRTASVASEIWVMTNVAAATIKGKQYVFRYDRRSNPRRVEVRKGSWAGQVVGTFTNENTADEIDAFIGQLAA